MSYPIVTARWWAAAGVRALKTVAQTGITAWGTDAVGIMDIDWTGGLSLMGGAAVLSLLMSIRGLPEIVVESDATPPPDDYEPRYSAEP